MKKIFYSLVIFISLFIFSDNVKAVDPSYSCHYTSSKVDFTVVYNNTGALYGDLTDADVIVKPLSSSFKIGNTEYTDINSWIDEQLIVYGRGNQLNSTDKCYDYMYFDQVDEGLLSGWWNGTTANDKIYFSDEYMTLEGVDLVLTLVEYADSPENVILNELLCTYGANPADLQSYSLTDLNTVSFKITSDKEAVTGQYEIFTDMNTSLYKGNYSVNKKSNTISYMRYNRSYTLHDQFHIRIFWDEDTDSWTCPKQIYIGMTSKIGLWTDNVERYLAYSDAQVSEFYEDEKWNEYTRGVVNYYLNYDASHVDYEQSSSAQGKMCVFSEENSDSWAIALKETSYSDGDVFYKAYRKSIDNNMKNVTINVPSGIIFNDCSGLTEIYTDCLAKEKCTISTTYFEKSTKLVSNAKMNSEDSGTAEEGTKLIDGEEYKQLLCNLSGKVNKLKDKSIINSLPTLKVSNNSGKNTNEYKINTLACEKWKYSTTYNCPDNNCDDIGYTISNQVRAIRDYCNIIYERYINNMSDPALIARKDECQSFNIFYDSLVKKGVIKDLTAGCDFISNELGEKLIWILNLLKIAGPILALGLGTLDFIKVIASGDSDKEMKNAFKRFSIRILAAILLFIIPVILAFLMDAFIGNQEGYDTDNPFCIDVYGGK